MENHSTSLLSRCKQVFFKRDENRLQCSGRITTRSWPRAVRSQSDQDTTYEEHCMPLLESSYRQVTSSSRRFSLTSSSTSSRRRSHILALPPWCRLPSSSRFTTVTTYFLLTLILIAQSTSAVPLQQKRYHGLVERQSIPDQFGNTGNEPAPVAPPRPPQVATPTANSALITSTVPTISPRVSGTTIVTPPVRVTISASSLDTIPTSVKQDSSSQVISTSTASQTRSPSPSNPDTQLQRTKPQNPLSPATIAGIVVGSIILLALVIGVAFLIYRRKKDREVEEIAIRRSKLGSRLGFRMFGNYYDDNIARSRKGSEQKFTERPISPKGSLKKEMSIDTSSPPVINLFKPPISPSVYSPRPLTRATRLSTMTFGSVGGWLDKSTIGRPQPAFTGTPSQLLDAPRPLFAQERVRLEKGEISPPRPTRPGSAEPLGRLSGMGYGLGLR